MLQIYRFRVGEFQKKVRRKFVTVAADGLIEDAGFDSVKFGKIGVENHPFIADGVDDSLKVGERRGG